MENLIRKILKEETSNFNKFEMGVFKIIDKIGIEGEVIRYGAVVALLMTLAVAIMTYFWFII